MRLRPTSLRLLQHADTNTMRRCDKSVSHTMIDLAPLLGALGVGRVSIVLDAVLCIPFARLVCLCALSSFTLLVHRGGEVSDELALSRCSHWITRLRKATSGSAVQLPSGCCSLGMQCSPDRFVSLQLQHRATSHTGQSRVLKSRSWRIESARVANDGAEFLVRQFDSPRWWGLRRLFD